MEKTMTMQENIMAMMNAEIENLESDLLDAKISYANINLDDGDYKCRDERKTHCKVLEGQIVMVKLMMSRISSIMPDIKMPVLANM